MMEDVFVKNEADELTTRIAVRLGERQYKLDSMRKWEQETHRSKFRPLFYISAIAACALVLVVIAPLWKSSSSPLDDLGIVAPEMTEFRSASSEIAKIKALIEEEQYEEALKRTAKALKASDLTIYELENIPEVWGSDEETVYEDEMERVKNCELRWVYIYLLVKNEDFKTAKKELRKYLKYPHFCEHEDEAKALLKKL